MIRGLALPLMLLGSAALVPAASAQEVERNRYTVLVGAGYTSFDNSSALRNAAYGGIEANNFITQNLALGGFFLASRPTTDGSMFPLIRLQFGDTLIYYLGSQQVMLLEAGVQALGRVPLGRLALVGSAGVGMYRIDLDPQRAERPSIPGEEVTRSSGPSFQLGAGATLGLGGGGGLRLQVRDFIYTRFDREKLSLVEPLLRTDEIPHPRASIPEAKSTIHNLRVELSVSFSPGSSR